MSRQAYVDHKKKLILFWSPKVACTSLVHWFTHGALGLEPGYVKEKTPYKDARAWLKGEGYHVDHVIAKNMIERGGYQSVVVSRHPATRALSAYINKFVRYQNRQIDVPMKLEHFSKQAYKAWKGIPPRAVIKNYEGLSFIEFLTHIRDDVAKARETKDEPQLNNHWNTQVPFRFLDWDFKYDHAFQLESFGKAIDWLNKEYGMAAPEARTNVTKYGTEAKPDAAHLSSVELSHHAEWLTPENFLTDEALDLIAEAYAIDYDYFGYDPKDVKAAPKA